MDSSSSSSSSRSSQSSSITRLLNRLPEGDNSVESRLFHFYFTEIQRLARRRIQSQYRGVADEEDVALMVLTRFLMEGREGELPEFQSREDALRMLADRVKKRAINHNRDAAAKKRGGGQVQREAMFGNSSDSSSGGGLANFPGREAEPWEPLLRVEEIEDLHGKLQQGLADDTLIQVFELWREGRTVTQMMDALGMSRATVYRKLELITLRGQQLFAPPDNT